MTEVSRESRIIGALLALHAGDSLGATLEFKSHWAIEKKYPNGLRDIIGGGAFEWTPGHATDDTDLTRCVLLAYRDVLVRGNKSDVAMLAGLYFLKWLDGEWPDRKLGEEPDDIGCTTADGLDNFAQTRDPDNSGAGIGKAGNGSLMRCLPTALFQPDPDLLVSESMRISSITHNDPRCTISCAAYNRIVADLIDGVTAHDAVQSGMKLAEELEGNIDGPVTNAIRLGISIDLPEMAAEGPCDELEGGCAGFVLESLSLAVAAVLDQRSLEDILVDVVRVGEDTDTNAAISGGLLGAKYGKEAIPERWRTILQFGDEFEKIATQLLAAQQGDAQIK